MSEQIERIREMEGCYDEVRKAAGELDRVISAFEEQKDNVDKLKGYYDSSLWMKDYEDDEAGKLPADLKRGVLSQDAVYDLLEELRDLSFRLNDIAADLTEDC